MKRSVSSKGDEFDCMIREQGPRIKATASQLSRRLPVSVDREDLEQDGFVGLMEAMVRWTRSNSGEHFQSYVTQRTRGAMLDGLRNMDPASRRFRAQMRLVEQAIQQLSHRLGCLPREGQVAEHMGIPLEEYQQLLQQAQGYNLLALEDFEQETESPDYLAECARRNEDPLVVLERSAFRQGLARALAELDAPYQQVLHLYYGMGLRMHEVGSEMGLTESRVSQLHTHAIAELRAFLQTPDARFSMLKPRSKPR